MGSLTAIVLAAGKGTRMRSELAKVLHPVGGRPLVSYPLELASGVGVSRVVVVTGHQGDLVRATVEEAATDADYEVRFAHQAEQNGTGHAVVCGLPEVPAAGPVLILSGDVPLTRPETIAALLRAAESSPVGSAVCTFEPDDRTGYGRLVRDQAGAPVRIREERDASPEEFAVRECNAGIYCFDAAALHRELPRLRSDNVQGEIYLTDMIEVLARHGAVGTVAIDPLEAAGANTPEQLANLDAAARSPVPG